MVNKNRIKSNNLSFSDNNVNLNLKIGSTSRQQNFIYSATMGDIFSTDEVNMATKPEVLITSLLLLTKTLFQNRKGVTKLAARNDLDRQHRSIQHRRLATIQDGGQ